MYLRSLILLALTYIFLSVPALTQTSTRTLYVLNSLGRTLSKVDLNSGVVVNDWLTVGEISNQIFAYQNKIYVVNSLPPAIMILEVPTGDVSYITLAPGTNPYSMAFVNESKAYVTNLIANSVSVVDLTNRQVLKEIPVGIAPEGIIVVGRYAYVANSGGWPDYKGSAISVIDVAQDSVLITLPVATNPQALAYTADSMLHVVCTGNYDNIHGQVVVLDPRAVLAGEPAARDTIQLGGAPSDLVITRDGLVYLADYGDMVNGLLYCYEAGTRTVRRDAVNPLRVGNGAINLLYDTAANRLWVNNFADDTVQELDATTGTILRTFPVGDGAQDMALIDPNAQVGVPDARPLPTMEAILFPNYPNPFNPQTQLQFSLPERALVTLEIYNLQGQQIRALVTQTDPAGTHAVSWDGRDDLGHEVASGVYFVTLKVGAFQTSQRLLRLK